MDISRLITYAKQIEKEKLRERSRGFKKIRVDDGGFNPQRSSHGGIIKGQGSQRFLGQGSTNAPTPKFNKDKGAKLMIPRDNIGTQAFPSCGKCGKTHKGECLVGSNACFKCGKPGYHALDCRSGGGGRTQGQVAHGQPVQGGGQ
ncbi:glycine-rich RNA-binding protein RZ1C-like [Solanum dulcamara]|uniref:glycine-rich RNA-binding protein RZ1C-like n=1 Tax=Solanum dulcamara TaxID=45834 RepID=UPI002486C648|nr:glycine-rich RNA-binding protein RZ1C-like [Solanum dulcamara]